MLFLVLLLGACTQPWAAFASNCTAQDQQQALVDIYNAWGGPGWRRKDNWLDTSLECEDSGTQLPAHCCWHGVLCCLSETCEIGDRPDIDRCGCEPGLAWAIELDSNNLEGNFSSMDHSIFACELFGLRLPNNKLKGPIGQDFTVYRKLGYAELQDNSLQGPLPKGLGDIFSLWLFFLARNLLEGPVPADICGENSKLFFLSLEKNRFSGGIDLAKCTQLGYFYGEGNNFSAVFTSAIPTLPTLRGVYMGQNNIRGVIPRGDFLDRLPHLEELGLFQNHLSGPLPEMTMFSMQYISFADNRFTGRIPNTWSRVARPDLRVFLQTNYLSCCGTNPLPAEELTVVADTLRIDEVYQGVDYSAPILPPFLELSDVLEPVRVFPRQSFKATGLRCPQLKLSELVDFEPIPGHPTSNLQWYLDPSYYMFEKCVCEEGLQLVNLTKPGRLPYLECQAPELVASDGSDSWEEAYPWAIVIIVVVGCFLLITMLLGLYLYKGTEVVQRLNNLKKRMHGLPTSGPFTAVVTDIQGWTALCAQFPELSWKVLSIHNSILRKARWNNFGSTHETEGDSFTMVFYDAKDAVAFCLQAQQMLSMQQWPIHKEINSEEQSTPLMSSYVNPVSDLPLKKSRSISSLSILQPLSSSHPLTSTTKHHGVDQDKNVNIDVQVRMGLASGFLCPGESLHAHPTIEFAKEVSDAAVGGQILMEGSTFDAIKDVLGELGTVDAQGMHLDRLRMRRVFSWPAFFLCRFIAPPSAASEDAVVLDMGTYTKSRPDQEQKQTRPAPNSSFPARSSRSFLLTPLSPKLSLTGYAQKSASPEELHLYQVLSAAGAERAKGWGSNLRLKSRLSLKDSLSKGYFDAPGTLAAPLGISKSPADASLPLVTTVFAAVEHARVFSSREIRHVERGLLACACTCLDQVKGDGYLCRSFGNLKLMLCFSKPEAALAWSCAMQECMMARPWPRAAMKEPFKEMLDQHGNFIFRGPRLKIGISFGRPDSIQPDHLGRADYHGDCVNSAARFMEGAAQGGMIVCERDVAMRAAEAWSSMQSSSEAEQTTETTLQVSRSWSASQSAHSSHEQQQTPRDGQLQQDLSPSPASAVLSSPPDEVKLKAPAFSRASPCSEPLYLLQPPLPAVACSPKPALRDGNGSGNLQNLGSIHVFWLGMFRFKGITHTKSMVHVLQDKLAPRAAKFTAKSLNPIMATLVSQQQPEGPSKSTYLVPLPDIDAELASSPQDQGARLTSVRFETEYSQQDSDRLMKMSDQSWKGNMSSVHSQEIAPSPSPRVEALMRFQ